MKTVEQYKQIMEQRQQQSNINNKNAKLHTNVTIATGTRARLAVEVRMRDVVLNEDGYNLSFIAKSIKIGG